MSSIGNVLKEARTKKAITLDEVHSRIKIHPRVLQLLEEDKFEKLPSPLFVKSFLKSYAEFLEVDPEELLLEYEKELKAPEQVLYIKTVDEKRRRAPIDKNIFVIPAAVVALVVLVIFVSYSFRAVGGWISKHKATTQTQKVKTSKAAAQKTVKQEKVSVPTASKPVVRTIANPAAEETKASGEWIRSVDQGNFPKIGKKAPLQLSIKAVDAVWLRITCDGKVLFQSILKKGTSDTWTANDLIEIWTGNSSNMLLTLNNYSLGSPGKAVVKKMIINHEGVKIPTT